MTSSPTLPSEWAGGGSGSAGSIIINIADVWSLNCANLKNYKDNLKKYAMVLILNI